MATKQTAAPPPSGNLFEFFVPKQTSPAPGTSPSIAELTERPKPAAPSPAANTTPKYPKPAKFIKDNFELLLASARMPVNLTGHHIIQDLQVVRAALECGYGRRSNWTSALALRPHEGAGLARYLIVRLQMVASCIDTDAHGARAPRSFYVRVESSEKLALSFILGGIGTYLAARKWLEARGETLDAFLHAGIYSKAINGGTPLVPFAPASGKMPDYIVAATNGNWHVFESKGGVEGSRWTRIVEGLAQLEGLPNLGWAGASTGPVPPTTCVCVHTSVNPGRKLHVTAVDPPGDGTPEDGRPEPPKDKPPVTLIQGVCKLLLVLETLEQFYALGDNVIPLPDLQVSEWKMATSSQFGGLLVGVPERYISRERDVRRRLAVFLAITEVLSEPDFDRSAKTLVSKAAAKFKPSELGEGALRFGTDRARRIISLLARDIEDKDFLRLCSERLKLNKLAQQVLPTIPEQIFFTLARTMPHLQTSGGMYLEQLPRDAPPAMELVAHPARPRG